MQRMASMDAQIKKIDKHYDGVSRAILSKQGVMLQQVNEYHILKEYQRLKQKENEAKQRLK